MEPPVKIELPRLTHLHALQLLLPLIPGILMTVGLTVSSSALVRRFEVTNVGYKTKVAIVLALTYVIGLFATTLTQLCSSLVMGWIKSGKSAAPWLNSYWRRVAVAYVGSNLSPNNASFAPQELDRLSQYVASMVGQPPDVLAGLADLRENKAKEAVLNQVESRLRAFGTELEWQSLYQALGFLRTDVGYPYAAFNLLTSCLQASGFVMMFMMFQYHELRSFGGGILAGVLVLTSSYVLWLDFEHSRYLSSFNPQQVAAMLQEIRKGPIKENADIDNGRST